MLWSKESYWLVYISTFQTIYKTRICCHYIARVCVCVYLISWILKWNNLLFISIFFSISKSWNSIQNLWPINIRIWKRNIHKISKKSNLSARNKTKKIPSKMDYDLFQWASIHSSSLRQKFLRILVTKKVCVCVCGGSLMKHSQSSENQIEMCWKILEMGKVPKFI